MKKATTKLIAVIMAIAICLMPVLSISAFAVTYPDGVTKATVTSSIDTFDTVLKKLMATNAQTADLSKTVYASICSDATLNSLFSAVYKEMSGNENTLSGIGVNITPAGLSASLSAYPDVSSKLAACSNLAEAVEKSSTFKWGVSTKEGFKAAVASMFSPFNSALFMLLCSGSIKLNNYIAIKGSDGYTSAIIPLLQALECPSIMTQEDYTKNAAANPASMITSLVDMLFASIDAIIANPVKKLTGVLPHLAWYLNSGKLSASLNTLMAPLSIQIGFLKIPGISSLLGGITNIESETDLSSMLKSVDLSALTGSDKKITLPDIDLDALAACGKEDSEGNFTPDRADAFIVILNWLLDAVRQNKESFASDMGEDAAKIIEKLLAKDNNTLIKTVFALLSAGEMPRSKVANYSYPDITQTTVAMPEGLTEDNLMTVVNGTDKLITQFLQESDPEANIDITVRKSIYSNKVAGTILVAVYGALGGADLADAVSMLGINATPSGIAGSFSKYSSVAKTLRNASSWENVKAENLNFGFSDGDRDSFRSAMVAILKPLESVLSFFLAGGTITVLDAIEIRGTNGYETAYIPLLEALSCDSQALPSYSSFRTNPEGIIPGIVDPILSVTDKICSSPVESICTMLPNAVYFLNSGVLKDIVGNLMYPVTALLSEAGLDDLVTEDMFSGLSDLNLDTIMKQVDLSSLTANLGITLPTPNLAVLSTLGTVESRVSKMSTNGVSVYYNYVVADRPAVMITILRYIFGALKDESNSAAISNLFSSAMGSSEEGEGNMMSMYMGSFTEKLSGMTTDETIVYFYNLLFRETPKVEIEDDDETIPTIIYKPESKINAKTIILIIFAVLLLALVVLWLLLRLGYLPELQDKLDTRRHAREKKKLLKEKSSKKKQMEKAKNNSNVIYSSDIDGAGRKDMRAADNKKAVQNRPAQNYQPAAHKKPPVAQSKPTAAQALRPAPNAKMTQTTIGEAVAAKTTPSYVDPLDAAPQPQVNRPRPVVNKTVAGNNGTAEKVTDKVSFIDELSPIEEGTPVAVAAPAAPAHVTASPKQPKASRKTKKSVAEMDNNNPYLNPAANAPVKPKAQPIRNPENRTISDKEAKKLEKRKQQAALNALKEEKKANKYYDKARRADKR